MPGLFDFLGLRGTPTPAADTAPAPAPSGLAGLFGGQGLQDYNLGARLQMAGAYLSQDPGAAVAIRAQMKGEQEKRRNREAGLRYADKIQASNPDLAAMIRSDPESYQKYIGTLEERKYTEGQTAKAWEHETSMAEQARQQKLKELYLDPKTQWRIKQMRAVDPTYVDPLETELGVAAPGAASAPTADAGPMPSPTDPRITAPASADPAMNATTAAIIKQAGFKPEDLTPDQITRLVSNYGVDPEKYTSTIDSIHKEQEAEQAQTQQVTQQQAQEAATIASNVTPKDTAYGTVIDVATSVSDIDVDKASGTELMRVMYSYAKTLDPMGSVREGDTALINQAGSLVDRINKNIAQLQEGGPIARSQAKEIIRDIQKMGQQSEIKRERLRRQAEKAAIARGIPKEKAREMIFGDTNIDMTDFTPTIQTSEDLHNELMSK